MLYTNGSTFDESVVAQISESISNRWLKNLKAEVEMDPELATVKNLEALRCAGYGGVGLWGWDTGDKYDWSADELERIVSPLVSAREKKVMKGGRGQY